MAIFANCCRCRRLVPHLESNARKCDTQTTVIMSQAHGTYVLSSVVNAASSNYVFLNNLRNGNALESSNPKGDDPWPTLHSPSPKAASPPRRQRAPPRFLSPADGRLMIARQRQAEREIARYLSTHRFTDETEREIERRFLRAPPQI